MVDLLSPRARAAADHVTAIETELTQLRADVAPALERIAILERSLDALELAALPGQLPLLDAGPTVAAPKPRPFRLTAKGEELLRAADANESRTVIVPRRNEADVDEVPEPLREQIELIFADDVSQVLEAALRPAGRRKAVRAAAR